jgi:hypothetical protein
MVRRTREGWGTAARQGRGRIVAKRAASGDAGKRRYGGPGRSYRPRTGRSRWIGGVDPSAALLEQLVEMSQKGVPVERKSGKGG